MPQPIVVPHSREDSPPAPPSFAKATAGRLEKEEPRRSWHGEHLILPCLFLPPEKPLNEFLIGPEPKYDPDRSRENSCPMRNSFNTRPFEATRRKSSSPFSSPCFRVSSEASGESFPTLPVHYAEEPFSLPQQQNLRANIILPGTTQRAEKDSPRRPGSTEKISRSRADPEGDSRKSERGGHSL